MSSTIRLTVDAEIGNKAKEVLANRNKTVSQALHKCLKDLSQGKNPTILPKKRAIADFSFGIIKGPSVERGHAFSILDFITKKGFKINRIEPVKMSSNILDILYRDHTKNEYYGYVKDCMLNRPCIAFTVVSTFPSTAKAFRNIIGHSSNSLECKDGTIRYYFGGQKYGTPEDIYADNAVHGSDSYKDAIREASLFFPEIRG